jgi:phage gp45-like
MIDAEITRFIRDEIKRQMDVILAGSTGDNSKIVNEDIENMYPGMPTILQRPVMHPYGFVSRAPAKTLQVVGKQGEHLGNRVVLGHRDGARPTDLASGESQQYSSTFYAVRASKDKLRFGQTTDGTDAGFAGQTSFTLSNEPGAEGFTFVTKKGSLIQMTFDGSINIVSSDGSYLNLNSNTGEFSLVSKDGNVIAAGAGGITIADKSGKNSVSMDGSGVIQVFGGDTVVVSAGQVNLKGGAVNLGNSPSDFATLCNALVLLFNTHMHPTAAPGPPSPPLVPAIPATPLSGGSFGSSAVQVSPS